MKKEVFVVFVEAVILIGLLIYSHYDFQERVRNSLSFFVLTILILGLLIGSLLLACNLRAI